MATAHDDYNNPRVKQEISIEDDDDEEGKKINKIQRGTRKLNGYAKPRLSYAQLIAEALMGAEKRRLTLNDIYVKINARHPYYSLGGDRGNIMSPPNWQNAVRHNLTLNKVSKSKCNTFFIISLISGFLHLYISRFLSLH